MEQWEKFGFKSQANMKQTVLSILVTMLLTTGLPAQKLVTETASNFVNYNINRINQVRAYLPHYNGEGRTVSIKEFRFDSLDIDFRGRYLPGSLSPSTVSAHATLMATIIGGGGNSDRSGLGVAWRAGLSSSSFLNIFPDDNSYFEQTGISVQNHSYGIDSIENHYGILAASYDLQVSQLPHLLHVFSIGNLGLETPTTGPYAGLGGFANMTGEFKLAKNVLTLGVVDSFGIIDPLSSHGPAFDGRIKPELVAFGIDGASAAAALASGSSLLIQQAYHELEGALPAAALVKALLINGAQDLGTTGPDHIYGFGNIDLYRSLQTLLAGRYVSDTLSFASNYTYQIDVPDHVRRLKITLAWTDPPAPIGTEKALVNDIDMRLTRLSDSQEWWPLHPSIFPHPDSLQQAATQGADHINNLEQIILERPEPGTYRIDLEAYDFGVDRQPFQLVYDWDTTTAFEWLFPVAGDLIVPSDRFYEQLHWRGDYEQANGSLSYTLDGTNWAPINDAVTLAAGSVQTFFPDTVSQARLRMQIGTKEYISDTFVIAARPSLRFELSCADSVAVNWTKQAGIDRYRFYRLGERYMEPFLESSDTFAVIRQQDVPNQYLAFAPILKEGTAGTSSFAYHLEEQGVSCYAQSISGRIAATQAQISLWLASTYQVDQLILERLTNGQWAARQTINSITGTGVYDFTDPDLNYGLHTYRVGIALANGQTVYSELLTLFYVPPDQFVLYPNPFSRLTDGNIQVHYNTDQPEQIRFQLYTALGAQVMDVSLSDLQNAVFYEDFQSGFYFYRFVREGTLLAGGKLIVR